MTDKEKVKRLEDAFSSYIETRDGVEFCRETTAILSSLANKKINVTITGTSPVCKEPFFGMRIFPALFEVAKITIGITNNDAPDSRVRSLPDLCEKWKEIPNWELEIDSRLFNRLMISFNPQELTAMVLHEIGHTIYSDKKSEMFYRAYLDSYVHFKTEEKAMAKGLHFLYMIPLALASGMKDWRLTDADLREELFADQSVKKLGYGEHLISAFQKIIRAYGQGGYTNPKDSVENSVNLINLNVTDLLHRKESLKDDLYNTGVRHNSPYLRNMIDNIMRRLKIHKKSRYDGNVVLESFIPDFDNPDFIKKNDLIYDPIEFAKLNTQLQVSADTANHAIATEAFGHKKINVPSQLDVDTIFVEVDRIQNHADRRYVLDLIYNQEEKINHFLEICEYNDILRGKHESHMREMLRELADMRKAVLNKRSFDKQYKVFVKYPNGYEG